MLGYLIGLRNIPDLFETALVTKVIDGDTIELEDGRRVRYIGLDTPEINHPQNGQECFALEATVRNRELVEGKVVELQSGAENTDQYGRLLRYVYADGFFVNAQLIAEGLGYASSFGQERRFQQVFSQLEQYSKLRNRGLWNVCFKEE